MHDVPLLPRGTRGAIVLIALLQGLLLYAAQQLDGVWPVQDVASRYRWFAWTLTVPTAVALTVVDLRDRRLWLHALLGSAVVLALASWIGWNLQGPGGLRSEPLRLPFSMAMAIATFILLPWWQYRLQHGHWHATYDALSERAWQNGLTLALAAFFTGLTWLLLWLWAELFRLLKVGFFHELFAQPAFIALATGTLAGFGVLIGRTQQRAIQVTRQVLFAICRGLLPLLSLISVLFVASLPFTGLQSLWETRSAATLLLALILLLVVFANAVYQHDSEAAPYPRWLRRCVEASLAGLPVLAALALHATGQRIAQYGWTLDRFWAALIALLVAGYAVGYAVAPFRTRGRWLQTLEPVNRSMCWAVLAAAVLASSPLLDPVRITLASQKARLLASPARITADDALMLRFDVGRRGVQALRALQADAGFMRDPRALSVVGQALAAKDARAASAAQIDDGLRDMASLQRRLTMAQGSPAPPQSWWTAVLARELPAEECLRGDQPCIVLVRDIDADGRTEVLLCALPPALGAYCQLHAPAGAGWRQAASYSFSAGSRPGASERVHAAVRAGRLVPRAPRWPSLSLDGAAPVMPVEVDAETAGEVR